MTTADPTHHRTELWLVRHAESAGNAGGIFQGQRDYPLSPRGHEQAQALARRLEGVSFDHIRCSDLSRARHTAEALAGGRPVVIDPALREIDTGSWSGLTGPEIEARFPDEWATWMAHRDPGHRRGGGESYRDVQARMVGVLNDIAQAFAGRRVLIVAHGGCLTAYLAHLLELPLAALWRCSLTNTGITRGLPFAPPPPGMRIHPGRLIGFNDTTHLSPLAEEHAT